MSFNEFFNIGSEIKRTYTGIKFPLLSQAGMTTRQYYYGTYGGATGNPAETSNGRILNYGSLDSGIYLAAKQVPQFKHFEQQNLLYDKYPENIDEQNRYISDGLADYVAIAAKSGMELSDIYNKSIALKTDYTLVFSQEYIIAESAFKNKKTAQTYYLFELKED